jgi:hypothetical protein
MFVGAVSDNFDERIGQKIFHAEIVVDNDKVATETKAYKKILWILSFTDENGTNNMKQEIGANYKQVSWSTLLKTNYSVSKMTPIYSIWYNNKTENRKLTCGNRISISIIIPFRHFGYNLTQFSNSRLMVSVDICIVKFKRKQYAKDNRTEICRAAKSK